MSLIVHIIKHAIILYMHVYTDMLSLLVILPYIEALYQLVLFCVGRGHYRTIPKAEDKKPISSSSKCKLLNILSQYTNVRFICIEHYSTCSVVFLQRCVNADEQDWVCSVRFGTTACVLVVFWKFPNSQTFSIIVH